TGLPSLPPYSPLPPAARPIAVAVGGEAQFPRLAAAVLGPAGAADPRFATNADRVRHRSALVAALESRLTTRPAAHWLRELAAARIACGPVNTVPEAFAPAAPLHADPAVRLPHRPTPP